jgi:DNA mismatch endonuclease, patch repair protein
MRRIRSTNTNPELAVRSLAHCLGYRFRLHRKDLPGRPDLVFPSKRKVIFVHGCFWHQHGGCIDGRKPKSNTAYWSPKLTRNRERDKKNRSRLTRAGWRSLVIWECQTADHEKLGRQLRTFLGIRRRVMKSTRKSRKPIPADSIARLADQGSDVSRFFTNTGRTITPGPIGTSRGIQPAAKRRTNSLRRG